MNAITPAKTVRLVPITLYADLARIAASTLRAQNAFYRSKTREKLAEARDWERRLSAAAEGAISLANTTPPLFGADEPAAAEPLPTLDQVLRFLDLELEKRTLSEGAGVLAAAINILAPDDDDDDYLENLNDVNSDIPC